MVGILGEGNKSESDKIDGRGEWARVLFEKNHCQFIQLRLIGGEDHQGGFDGTRCEYCVCQGSAAVHRLGPLVHILLPTRFHKDLRRRCDHGVTMRQPAFKKRGEVVVWVVVRCWGCCYLLRMRSIRFSRAAIILAFRGFDTTGFSGAPMKNCTFASGNMPTLPCNSPLHQPLG